jgi:rhodanese-related sulfurtransferase
MGAGQHTQDVMGFLNSLFNPSGGADLEDLIQNQKAQIVDVRTPAEFKSGHVKGSINIPLNTLSSKAGKLDKNRPVITCCASGARSGMAVGTLNSMGFQGVVNGGSWTNVNRFKK